MLGFVKYASETMLTIGKRYTEKSSYRGEIKRRLSNLYLKDVRHILLNDVFQELANTYIIAYEAEKLGYGIMPDKLFWEHIDDIVISCSSSLGDIVNHSSLLEVRKLHRSIEVPISNEIATFQNSINEWLTAYPAWIGIK